MKISFTKEQLQAIRAPLEPSLVLAGAGTGKTSVMAERAIWLIENENISPNEILGLTFTNKAALELKTRIKNKLAKKVEFLEPTVSTYHSFALDILRDYGLSIGVDSDLQLISETSRISLAYQTLLNTDFEINHLDTSPRRIAQQIVLLDNQMSEHNLEKTQIIEYSNKLFTEILETKPRVDLLNLEKTLRQRIELANLVEEFRLQKLESGFIDFSDQMRFVYQLVKNNANIKEELRQNFKAVLLDEYQDTSVIQRMILVEVFGDAHPVTAVGDPLQAIYGWRGASVSNIDNFTNHFCLKDGTKSKIFNLTSNFRSGIKILEHANSISKSLREIHNAINILVADKEDVGVVKVGLFETSKEEALEIVKQIKDLIFEKKVNYEDIVILSRNTKELLPIYDLLIKNEIPAAFSGKQDLIDVPEVSEVLSYLRILEDPTHNPSLVRILSGPRFEISPRDLSLLADQAKTLVKDFAGRKNSRSFEESLKDSLSG
ncbi:MAG: ATP-dependent helicase, partial [Actinomycetes bacterium]